MLGSEKKQTIKNFNSLEQVTGIEPVSTAWKAVVIAIIRHLHSGLVHLSAGGPLFQADLPTLHACYKLKS